MKCYVGCSGWQYGHWKGLFYPEDLPRKSWLGFYTQHFNTVEINSTFYHFTKEKTFQKWYDSTPENFMFSVKANRMITHNKKLVGVEELVKEFYKNVSALKEKLGCILWQLPPSIHMDRDLEKVKNFLDLLDRNFRNVIEFRHKSWFCEEAYDMLRGKNVAFCCVSAPRLPDDIVSTASFMYVRFHGKNQWYRYNYDHEELRHYAEAMRAEKVDEIFCYFNNDFGGYAPENAMMMKKLLDVQ